MKSAKNVYVGLVVMLCLLILSGCCEYFPWLPWCQEDPIPETRTEKFTPQAITRLCPTHIGGDREFDGHGPDVTARASLDVRSSNTEIWVTLYLHAKETRDDWTEAEGNWERHLWTAPPGYSILNILTHQSSNANYRDTDHDLDRPSVQGGNLVSRFEIMGDTGGNDVGNCTGDDVYMNVYFNEVQVRIQEL